MGISFTIGSAPFIAPETVGNAGILTKLRRFNISIAEWTSGTFSNVFGATKVRVFFVLIFRRREKLPASQVTTATRRINFIFKLLIVELV